MESETGTGEVVTKTTFDIGAYWAILPTDDGRYILMAYPVAGKSNGNITRVLSATTNGTNYDTWTQATYIDDSNYLDEWDLALIKAYRYVGYEAQEKTNWCWAACSKMFLSSYGIVSCSQSDIVNYTTGSTADEPKDFSYMKRAVEYFGSSENLSVKKHEYKVFSENVLCSILRDDPEEENDVNHIVIIGRTWYPNLNDSSTSNGGHVTVIQGYVIINSEIWFIMLDPWPSSTTPYSLISYEKLFNGRDCRENEVPDTGVWTGMLTIDISDAYQVQDYYFGR